VRVLTSATMNGSCSRIVASVNGESTVAGRLSGATPGAAQPARRSKAPAACRSRRIGSELETEAIDAIGVAAPHRPLLVLAEAAGDSREGLHHLRE
jgi:hypothetical protein